MRKAVIFIGFLLILAGCLQPANNGGTDNTPKQAWIDGNFLKQFRDNPAKAFDGNSIIINLDSNSIELNFDVNLQVADKNFVGDVCSISCQYVYADLARLSEALPTVDLTDKRFPKSEYGLLQNRNTGEYSCLCTWRVCDSQEDPDFPGQLFCTDNSKKYGIVQNK